MARSPKYIATRRLKTTPLPEWRFNDSRFRLGTSPRETPEEKADKDRLIAEFRARKLPAQ